VAIPAAPPSPPSDSWFNRGYLRVAASPAGHWFVKNVSRRVDPLLLRVSRGRLSTIVLRPLVLLTTRGARTGERRTTPLVYFNEGDRVVLMASNYGGRNHPAWYYNIRANPEVTLSAGGHEGRYLAEQATGEERERLWGLAKQIARNYGQYEQKASNRQIAVFVLTPVGAEGGADDGRSAGR
jgi:deazaflavin-dependent oxidoreductase (nitroreductase family)